MQYKFSIPKCLIIVVFVLFVCAFFNCNSNSEPEESNQNNVTIDNPDDEEEEEENESSNLYAEIDFSNWKVTLPVDEDNNGKPDEYQPNELKDFGYQTLEAVKPYMFDDTSDTSLVFYTFPEVSTQNSSYSRTELRELINPSNSKENWTLGEGGELTGRLKVVEVSENSNSSDDFHKVIVMQIHGIISEDDMDTYGFSGNNGPPLIKIYWKDGYVWSHKKSLVDETTSGFDLYDVYNGTWTDEKVNLGYVGYEAFDFRITASDAKIVIQLNDDVPYIYEDISLNKWPFENYFKAGNYLTTTDSDAFSFVKYYNLKITH